MKYYLYIKTIAKEKSKVKEEIFNKIHDYTKLDKLLIVQRFIGKGFAKLEESSDIELLKKHQDALKRLKIESIIISENEIVEKNKRIFHANIIKEYDYEFEFSNPKQSIKINKKDEILIIGGVNKKKYAKSDYNNLLLNNDFAYILYFKNADILVHFKHIDVNYNGLKNHSKYSKRENFTLFINSLKNSAIDFKEDLFYSVNYIPDLFPDITEYASINALLFNKNLINFNYDNSFYNSDNNTKGIKNDYAFHYQVYKPGHKFKEKKFFNIENKVQKLFYPLLIFLIMIVGFLRTGFFVLFPYALLGVGVYYIYNFFIGLKFKMYIEDIPTSKIESISIGLREVKGKILKRNAIPSPISGIECVFFRYYKYKKYINSDGKQERRLIEIGEYLPKNFYIEENGNIIEVNTNNATFNLSIKSKIHRPYYSTDSVYIEKNVYYVEEILPVFSNVYIMGTVDIQDTKEAFSRFLKARKYDKEYMKQFDRDGNNEIDADEWDQAKLQIEREFEQIQNNKKQSELLQIRYTEDDRILYISDRSEKEIIKRLNIYILLLFLFGISSIIYSIVLLIRGLL